MTLDSSTEWTPPSADAEQVLCMLDRARRIVITTHVNPDGDALGSEYALLNYLKRTGADARIVNASPVPANLAFLNTGGVFEEYRVKDHRALLRNAELAVFLDLNSPDRAGVVADEILAGAAGTLVIDHHLEPKPFAGAYFLDAAACATSEILYYLLHCELGMPPGTALALYVGIMTDTGSFRFERTTPRVHRITANLLEAGVNPSWVYRRVHEEYSYGRTLLVGAALSSLRVICKGTATLMLVRHDDFRKTGTSLEDLENIVQLGLAIRGVEATALLAEVEEGVKISFRSRGETAIQPLAREFGGGGHMSAAGATVKGGDIDLLARDVQERLEKMLRDPGRNAPGD